MTYHYYAKLGVVCDTSHHFILACRVGRGPRPDVDEFRPLLAEALQRVRLSRMIADAGYDWSPITALPVMSMEFAPSFRRSMAALRRSLLRGTIVA